MQNEKKKSKKQKEKLKKHFNFFCSNIKIQKTKKLDLQS